jgi:OST3 / OST6 family, transporter family
MRAVVLLLTALSFAAGSLDDLQVDSRLAELRDLEIKGDGLATLTDVNFHRLARDKARPFNLFVLFNAGDPRYKCSLCGPFQEELRVLSESYRREPHTSKDTLPIVFAQIDVAWAQKTFNEYDLRHAPVLAYFPSTGPEAVNPAGKFPPGSQYTGELDAENAAKFVRDKTGYQINVYRSPAGKLAAVGTLIASVIFAAFLLRDKLGAIIEAVRGFLPLWILLAVGFYYIGVSGILYDIIRGVPFVGYDPKSKRTGLVAGGGSQYVLEGLIVGFCNVGAAAALVILAKVAPKVKNPGTRSFAFVAAGMTFLFLYSHIYSWYKMKTPWYSFARLVHTAFGGGK